MMLNEISIAPRMVSRLTKISIPQFNPSFPLARNFGLPLLLSLYHIFVMKYYIITIVAMLLTNTI